MTRKAFQKFKDIRKFLKNLEKTSKSPRKGSGPAGLGDTSPIISPDVPTIIAHGEGRVSAKIPSETKIFKSDTF